MKVLCFLLAGVLFSIGATAQKVFFLYLQSEPGFSFYAKLGDKTFSSSAPGYLILSNLVDSTYRLSIGRPGNNGEFRFQISLGARDRGFLVREEGGELYLSDLQSSSPIRPEKQPGSGGLSFERRNDNFTVMLAKASSDSSLLFVPVAVRQVVVQDEPVPQKDISPQKSTVEAVADTRPSPKDSSGDRTASVGLAGDVASSGPDSVSLAKTQSPAGNDTLTHLEKVETKADPVVALPSEAVRSQAPDSSMVQSYRKSTVKKHAESSTSEGFGLVYYDQTEAGSDTIRLLIPNPRFVFRQTDTTASENMDMLHLPDSLAKETAKPQANSCRAVATENDFFKLRRTMAARISDEDMVEEARKVFRSRCFSTEQIRNLGALFLTSAGKYQFFNAAYSHVTDRDQFASLGAEIRDEYYSKRFKVLVGQ